jgi:hypothetical protein
VLYAYVGVSKPVMDALDGDTAILSYFIVSGLAVVAGLVVTARHVGREA